MERPTWTQCGWIWEKVLSAAAASEADRHYHICNHLVTYFAYLRAAEKYLPVSLLFLALHLSYWTAEKLVLVLVFLLVLVLLLVQYF